MSKEYDLLVFIGRFQPFHIGHKRVIELALEQAKQVLVLVGSSFQPRTIKNPFTYEERMEMISTSVGNAVTIRPIRDYLYNDNKWMAQVQHQVEMMTGTYPVPVKVGIIGYEKDESSWYLNAFPQWSFVNVGRNYDLTIDATTIRQMWFTRQSPQFTSGALNTDVHNFIYRKFPKAEYERLVREFEHINDYKKQWANSPYPVMFNTVDAVVVQSGHILLIKRKSAPGEGLWAMPGGFLNINETIQDGMIRELREETRLKVPDPVLRGSIRARHVFDAPGRSLRGRTITNAFLIELPNGPLPKVKGDDDAAKAQWISIAEFEKMEDQMFEDHHYVVSYLLGRV